jgi:hypothetical protein
MKFPILMVFCLAVCMLAGNASAETRIMIPEGSFEDTADLPVVISGITAATGVSFELIYDKDIVCIDDIFVSSEIPGSSAIYPMIDNNAGYAKVAITNTDGISAEEPAPLAVIRFTRIGSGGGTVVLQDPRWSDTHFRANAFDVALDGNIVSLVTEVPIETTRSASDSHVSSSSGAPVATPTPGDTVTATTTALPVASPDDVVETLPAAPPSTTTEDTQPRTIPASSPGFCMGTIFAAGLVGIALLMHHRS